MTYLLTIPGKHEAQALSDRCSVCASITRPAVVLDLTDSRQAGYDCRCGFRWVKTWGKP